ncbi:MAG: AzlC family ABC transporter permease [Clostridia bacterium]|nr:AzlC family ABC transporter permease [Clostridia bacterium]
MKKPFKRGMLHGLPIALGYFSVSFGFGIVAMQSGLKVIEAVIISLTNLTSAGQAMGVAIIAAGGTLLEMAATQLVINLRYALMAISLSQKLDDSFTTPHRLLAAYGITDEIFAVAAAQDCKLVPSYMYGMISVAAVGWVGGTLAGSVANMLLPVSLTAAMGIMLYGMFIAIIIPPAKANRKMLCVILIAAALSCIFKYLLPAVSVGFAIIISAIVASVIGALLFPIDEEKEETAK